MKKGIFSSLVLASCLFATSVANADELNSVKFEQQYPHLYAYLVDWFSTAKVSTTIITNTVLAEAFIKTNESNANYAKLLQNNNASIDCLKKFDNHKNLPLETQALVKKLPPKDLQLLDNYYKDELGKAEIDFGKKVTTAAYNGDIKTQLATYKLVENENYQAISQQIHDYEKQHKALFERYHNALMASEVTKIEDSFIQSCKS